LTIPPIIHQIAPQDKELWHPVWKDCRKSWGRNFSGFEFKFWNDKEDIDSLVKDHYSQYWGMYQSLPAHIMRIDFARLCMLHKYGGIYADMDVFCYRNFYNLLTGADLFIMEAPYGDIPVENALMVSVKENPFFLEVMQAAQNNISQKFPVLKDNFENLENRKVIAFEAAGPGLIYEVLKNHQGSYVVLNGDLFNNHGMSYHPLFFTKHVLTGIWGNEGRQHLKDCFDKNSKKQRNFKDFMKQVFVEEAIKYSEDKNITKENFSFFKDYTNGQFLKRHDVWKTQPLGYNLSNSMNQ
jgi:hypothetical protein